MNENTLNIIAIPCWVRMINEIHTVLGYSYSRIAYRINFSPSGVQKLIQDFKRIPRDKMFFNLACYYHKLFYSPFSLPCAKKYAEENHDDTLCSVVIELINRGLIDDLGKTPHYQANQKKYIKVAQNKRFLGKETVSAGIAQLKPVISAHHTIF